MTSDNLRIIDEKTGLRIETFDDGKVAGLWVQDRDGFHVGIVNSPGDRQGPFVAIGSPLDHANPLAITHDGIQLPRKHADDPYRFIAWDDLYPLIPVKPA